MRPVTDNDFDAIYEIYTDKSVYPFMAFDINGKADFRPVFEMMKRRTHFWIFEDENGPYGMCTILQDIGRSAHVAYLGALGIKSSMQGKGHGRRTLAKIEEFLIGAGYKTLFFFVEGDNQKGMAFYDALGYQRTGSIPQYLKRKNEDFYVDEIIYAKVLN